MNYKGHLTVGLACALALSLALFVAVAEDLFLALPLPFFSLLHPFFSLPFSLDFKELPLWILICLFGSLAPDLDHKHSKIHRWSYTGSVSFGAALYLLSHEPFQALAVTAALVLTVFLLSRLKHRGFTHHAPGVVIFAVLLYAAFSVLNFSSPVVVTGFGVAGYLSHLAADFFSTRSKRKANKASKQTGKRASK
ncbi:MAG TPA: metal-dependent hydrolase [Methanomicrobia archaeon]|nr:metal-dependent hydrolase [Methanomicrobia archaeon]